MRMLSAAFLTLLFSSAVRAQPLIDFTRERLAFRQSVTDLFEGGQADALEKQAADLRVQRPRFSSGTPVLFDFYQAFNPRSKHIPPAAKEQYGNRVLLWAESKPDSLVATMAAIQVLGYKAWEARGTRYADEVTEEGWREFRRHRLKAWSLAKAAESRGTVDAALYELMLGIAKDLDQPRSEVDALFRKLIAIDPAFDQAFVIMGQYLLPRWHGSARELHDFALSATEQSRSVMGSAAYARIAIVVMLVERAKMVTDYPFEYRRLTEAFEDLDARYPNSGRTLNFYAWFALTYGDLPTARRLMDRIAREWTTDGDEVWGSRAQFDQARAAANGARAK